MSNSLLDTLANAWGSLPVYAQSALWSTMWILVVTVVLILSVAYLTLWERKVIGWMQLRIGPNRVRIFGLLPGMGQPFADVLKLMLKEIVIPSRANSFLFRLAPMIALIPAFAAWAVVPLHPGLAISHANAGLLYLLSLSSMGSTASSWLAGPATPSTPSWVRCARRPRWWPTRSPWASPWSGC
jgi:NADH-quinone oxidoreductase subunit H